MNWLWNLLFGKKFKTALVLATFQKTLEQLDAVAKNNSELAAKCDEEMKALRETVTMAEQEVAHATAVRTKLADLIK
jgi:hypothetical protein